MSSVIPCASATARPSAITAHASSRVGGSATCPCVRPVSAAIAFEAALKISFRHWAPRASASAWVGMPARVQASASASTASIGAGLGSNGPMCVSPRVSQPTWPGSITWPAGNVVPRITSRHVLRDQLLVAGAVLDGGDRAEGVRRRGDRLGGLHALHGDDPELAGRERRGVGGGVDLADHVARAGEPQPVRVDRVDVLLPRVVRPDLHVVERAEVRREQRPHRAAADHAYAHSRAFTSRYIAVCRGTGTPCCSASRTSAPVMKSTSVGRPLRTSSSIDGTWA